MLPVDPPVDPPADERTIDEQIADAISNPNLTPEAQEAIEAMMRATYAKLVEADSPAPVDPVQPAPTPEPPGFVEMLRLSMEVCPGCGTELGHRQCHFTYSTWHCWGCGGTIDGRVARPKSVRRCENEWTDYEGLLGDTLHPIACACSGRGWFEWEEPTRAR